MLRGWTCGVLGAVALLAATPGRADPLTPFEGGEGTVTVDDVRPHFDAPECRNNEYYQEWWAFTFFLEGGYEAYVRFILTNMGVGDGHANVSAELTVPGQEPFDEGASAELGQWTSAKDAIDLRVGDNSMSGPLDGLVVRLKNPSYEAEYRLKQVAAPWKAGRARYGDSSDRYFQIDFPAPVAAVEGTVKVVGEDQVRPVKGLVSVEHQLSTIGMHEQAKESLRYRHVSAKTTFLAGDYVTPAVYGGERVQYAVLYDGGRKVFGTTRFDVSPRDFYQDPKKSEYRAPRLAKLDWTDGDTKYAAVLKATKMTSREDYLESSGAVAAFVISKFAKPIMYYFDGQFAVEASNGGKVAAKYGGKGRYFFTVFNP
jgi:hypothetical protein